MTLSDEDISYLLDRLFVAGWLITTVTWIANLAVVTSWLTFATLLIGGADILVHFHLYRRPVAWAPFLVFAGLAVLFSVWINDRISHNEQLAEETETHGWLVPANDPAPLLSGCEPSKGALIVFLGSDTLWTTLNDQIVMTLYRQPIVTIHRTKQGLQVDAKIFNRAGIGMVNIDRNEFNLMKGEHEVSYVKSRETDRSTLLVYGPQFEEVLYVRYLNPSAVRIRGSFYAPHASVGVSLTDSETRFINADGTLGENFEGYNCEGLDRPPLFTGRGLMNFNWNQ
jgi:hypothetical protein